MEGLRVTLSSVLAADGGLLAGWETTTGTTDGLLSAMVVSANGAGVETFSGGGLGV